MNSLNIHRVRTVTATTPEPGKYASNWISIIVVDDDHRQFEITLFTEDKGLSQELADAINTLTRAELELEPVE